MWLVGERGWVDGIEGLVIGNFNAKEASALSWGGWTGLRVWSSVAKGRRDALVGDRVYEG